MANTLAAYEAAEVAFDAACQVVANARRALARSKSKANVAAFIAAEAEYEATLAVVIAARDAYEVELEASDVIAAASAATCHDVQMNLF